MTTRFIELAGEVNSRMPEYVVSRLMEFLNERGKPLKGSRICLLGVAYKRDVDDPRESPAFVLMELLRERGVVLSYNDPHIPKLPKMRHHDVPELESCPLTPEFLAAQDAILIATDHSAYDYDFIVEHAPFVVDTRNATKSVTEGRQKIRKSVERGGLSHDTLWGFSPNAAECRGQRPTCEQQFPLTPAVAASRSCRSTAPPTVQFFSRQGRIEASCIVVLNKSKEQTGIGVHFGLCFAIVETSPWWNVPSAVAVAGNGSRVVVLFCQTGNAPLVSGVMCIGELRSGTEICPAGFRC